MSPTIQFELLLLFEPEKIEEASRFGSKAFERCCDKHPQLPKSLLSSGSQSGVNFSFIKLSPLGCTWLVDSYCISKFERALNVLFYPSSYIWSAESGFSVCKCTADKGGGAIGFLVPERFVKALSSLKFLGIGIDLVYSICWNPSAASSSKPAQVKYLYSSAYWYLKSLLSIEAFIGDSVTLC